MSGLTLDRDSFRVYRAIWSNERTRDRGERRPLTADQLTTRIMTRWPDTRPEAFDRASEFYDENPYRAATSRP